MSKVTVALIGNPNCGKSTIFNLLTGAKQSVGNWAGVTVDKTSLALLGALAIEIIDLPGTYSLNAVDINISIDEKIALEHLLENKVDIILNIVDASNLERNLYLTLQLLETGIPVIVGLNMLDLARKAGKEVDVGLLSELLGCTVVPLVALHKKGLNELRQCLSAKPSTLINNNQIRYSNIIEREVLAIIAELEVLNIYSSTALRRQALSLLEGDILFRKKVAPHIYSSVIHSQQRLKTEGSADPDVLIATSRYQLIDDFSSLVMHQSVTAVNKNFTQLIDKVALHRILGLPLFLFVMYSMFVFSINIGGLLQDFFALGSEAIFVDGCAVWLHYLVAPNWLIALIAYGFGKGINTVVSFIPVIGAMFFALAILEDSGYMVRAAFLMDKLMRFIGLPGKSFVPMIVGFGCNVPSVMGARTLENKQDRILTIMISPFMSCNARLAIFTLFVTAFFKQGGQNIIFLLYLIGIVMAIFTGLVLKNTLLRGKMAPMVLELSPYHVPNVKRASMKAGYRLANFLKKAGILILPLCLVLSFFNTLEVSGDLNTKEASSNTVISLIGKKMTPIFHPMGITEDNWPATVGLLTGIMAKEVVVGTLNALYEVQIVDNKVTREGFNLKESLIAAVFSIKERAMVFFNTLLHPLTIADPSIENGVIGAMQQKFDGKAGAFAYLLFILLYMPCVSVTGAIAHEIGKRWAIFSVFWTTLLAYGSAVVFYQIATFSVHKTTSSCWIIGIILSVGLSFVGVKKYANSRIKRVPTRLIVLG